MAAAKAPAKPPATTTINEKLDKTLSQLGEFNLRIDDLFRTTSGAIATVGSNREPVEAAEPMAKGGISNTVWIALGAVVLAFVLIKPLRKMIGLG